MLPTEWSLRYWRTLYRSPQGRSVKLVSDCTEGSDRYRCPAAGSVQIEVSNLPCILPDRVIHASGKNALCFFAERAPLQILQSFLAGGGLGVDLQHLLPGGVSAFPIFPSHRNFRQRAQRGKIPRFQPECLFDVADRARRVAGMVLRDGA